jgi:hypothetical protein
MSRKRSNKKPATPTLEELLKGRVPPLMPVEETYPTELKDCSARYNGVLQQKANYDFILKRLQENRKKVQKEEVKAPFFMPLIPKTLFYQTTDKKEVLKMFDEAIKSYTNTIAGLNGQVEQRYEEYVESGVRNREFYAKRFGNIKAKDIMPDRNTALAEEETLFEAEFEEMLKEVDGKPNPKYDPEKVKAFKKSKAEAVKRNAAKRKGKK